MADQLIFTSAAAGLRPGSRGFTTVAATGGMSPALWSRLEAISSYRLAFNISDARASLNPINLAHVRLRVGDRTHHLLSRVAPAPADYSGRSNYLAHHVVLQPSERIDAGPAAILNQPELMATTWSGPPRELPTFTLPTDLCSTPAPCVAWRNATAGIAAGADAGAIDADVTRDTSPRDVLPGDELPGDVSPGDAGWAGLLLDHAMAGRREPAYVIFPPELAMFPLFDEALTLLPPAWRWRVTFSSYFTGALPDVHCQWRGVLAGTSIAEGARGERGALVIDLTRPLAMPPATQAVDAARQGVMVASVDQVVDQAVDPTVDSSRDDGPVAGLPSSTGAPASSQTTKLAADADSLNLNLHGNTGQRREPPSGQAPPRLQGQAGSTPPSTTHTAHAAAMIARGRDDSQANASRPMVDEPSHSRAADTRRRGPMFGLLTLLLASVVAVAVAAGVILRRSTDDVGPPVDQGATASNAAALDASGDGTTANDMADDDVNSQSDASLDAADSHEAIPVKRFELLPPPDEADSAQASMQDPLPDMPDTEGMADSSQDERPLVDILNGGDSGSESVDELPRDGSTSGDLVRIESITLDEAGVASTSVSMPLQLEVKSMGAEALDAAEDEASSSALLLWPDVTSRIRMASPPAFAMLAGAEGFALTADARADADVLQLIDQQGFTSRRVGELVTRWRADRNELEMDWRLDPGAPPAARQAMRLWLAPRSTGRAEQPATADASQETSQDTLINTEQVARQDAGPDLEDARVFVWQQQASVTLSPNASAAAEIPLSIPGTAAPTPADPDHTIVASAAGVYRMALADESVLTLTAPLSDHEDDRWQMSLNCATMAAARVAWAAATKEQRAAAKALDAAVRRKAVIEQDLPEVRSDDEAKELKRLQEAIRGHERAEETTRREQRLARLKLTTAGQQLRKAVELVSPVLFSTAPGAPPSLLLRLKIADDAVDADVGAAP